MSAHDTGEMNTLQWKNTNNIQHKRCKNWSSRSNEIAPGRTSRRLAPRHHPSPQNGTKYIDPRSNSNRNTESLQSPITPELDEIQILVAAATETLNLCNVESITAFSFPFSRRLRLSGSYKNEIGGKNAAMTRMSPSHHPS